MEDDLPSKRVLYGIALSLIVIFLFCPFNIYKDSLAVKEDTALRAVMPHYLTEDILLEILLDKIVECESGGDSLACNKEFGCSAGMGLVQLIPSTVRYCEEKLEKEIDPFDSEDNMECARYLLKNEGWGHWGCAGCDWGSYECFKAYIP